MSRESIYVCTYTAGEREQVAYVSAWDDREAAELLAREIELESDGEAVPVGAIRVRPIFDGEGASVTSGA